MVEVRSTKKKEEEKNYQFSYFDIFFSFFLLSFFFFFFLLFFFSSSFLLNIYIGQQKHLTDAIETALRHPTCPTSVLNSLLNMAEYMDQTEHPLHLQLDIHNLGGCALRTRTYAKALHCAFYNFLQFLQFLRFTIF